MKDMRNRLFNIGAVIAICILASCSTRYQEPPFGGMNGRVQKVTITHKDPEVWHTTYEKVLFIGTSVYDVNGYEICSALMDSAWNIVSESENLFENGNCVRSIRKSGNRVVARLDLFSGDKNKLEYKKEVNGQIVTMTVKKSSFFRRHKSVVSENGKVTTISIIQTDRYGYPVKITTTDTQTATKTVETNVLDDKHNIIEKHAIVNGNKDEEEVTFIEYRKFDEHGNWLEARSFNRHRLPMEVLLRDIEYW